MRKFNERENYEKRSDQVAEYGAVSPVITSSGGHQKPIETMTVAVSSYTIMEDLLAAALLYK